MTRDAASCSVTHSQTLSLRRQSGLGYHKAYSLSQHQFGTPVKDIQAFANPMFELLGNHPKEIPNWYRANRKGPNNYISVARNFQELADDPQRARQIKLFLAAKNRIKDGLESTTTTRIDHAVRKEFRERLNGLLDRDWEAEVEVSLTTPSSTVEISPGNPSRST